MKKILVLIVFIFMPLICHAEMNLPSIRPYTVAAKDSSGVRLYRYECDDQDCYFLEDDILPQSITFEVTYEYDFDGELYVNYEEYFIKLSELSIVSDTTIDFNDESIIKIDVNESLVLTNLNVYEAPAYGYKLLGEIKKDTTIELLYNYKNSGWYYIEYGDIKGWVNALNNTIGIRKKDEALFIKETDFFDLEGEKIGTIPANEKISEYYEMDSWSLYYGVKYNDTIGLVEKTSFATSKNYTIYTLENTYAFELFNNAEVYSVLAPDYKINTSNTVEMPKSTSLKVKYYYKNIYNEVNNEFYLVEYNNKEYWLVNLANSNLVSIYIGQTGKVLKDTNLIAYPSSDIINSVKKDTQVSVIYELNNCYYYVEGKNIAGYINDCNEDTLKIANYNRVSKEVIIENKEQVKKTDKNLNKNIIIGIISGIVIISTLIVGIIFLRKRKNKIS